MPDKLESYKKKKDFLICIDSDGCAMDTMDSKHIRCFGPCLVAEWGLEPWQDEILERWNEVNLYSMNRGINRFKGLAMILSEVNEKMKPIDGILDLRVWTETTSELSNKSIYEQYDKTGKAIFAKALKWSEDVNECINMLPESEKCIFEGVQEAVRAAKQLGDIAVVSSANQNAVLEEWKRQGLLGFVDIVLSQDAGSKADCIRKLLKKGYRPDRVLMVGDAPGDCYAAEENHVNYYPILVRKEAWSWKCFVAEALVHLAEESYSGDYQNYLVKIFAENLS